MQIDDRVQTSMRMVLAAVAGADANGFDDAIEALADQGEEHYLQTLQLTIAAGVQTLRALHDGGYASEEALEVIARRFGSETEWAQIDDPTLGLRYLTTLQERDGFSRFTTLEITLIPWVIGGWLLKAYAPEGLDWEDFLDLVLQRVENDED